FFRHTPSGMVLKKKGDEQLTAFQTTFRRENLSLAGCSSAEPASVSVQQYKIQISKLYLQPVEIPSHFHSQVTILVERFNRYCAFGNCGTRKYSSHHNRTR